LSNLLEHKENNGQDAALLLTISPVAWQHINIHGRYVFRKDPENIDMNAIVHKLSQIPVKQMLAE